jgi:isopentenyl-diphosphate delta-isomerase
VTSSALPLVPPRKVVLCDAQGIPSGTADLIVAHTGDGLLHLAFSVYVFSPDRRHLLIQQRSSAKMLWPLVWANTCCSHLRDGEIAIHAGQRRLKEEMGFVCHLTPGPEFVYRAADPNGRGIEHEYDVTLVGQFAGDPVPDHAEVAAWKWADLDLLQRDMQTHAEQYAPWFRLGLPKVIQEIDNLIS